MSGISFTWFGSMKSPYGASGFCAQHVPGIPKGDFSLIIWIQSVVWKGNREQSNEEGIRDFNNLASQGVKLMLKNKELENLTIKNWNTPSCTLLKKSWVVGATFRRLKLSTKSKLSSLRAWAGMSRRAKRKNIFVSDCTTVRNGGSIKIFVIATHHHFSKWVQKSITYND